MGVKNIFELYDIGYIGRSFCITNLEDCADFEVRFCCPTRKHTACDEDGWSWSIWLDRDDPAGTGDWEIKGNHPAHIVCANPKGIQARIK